MRAYIRLFQNYADFKGFMKRGEYWTAMIIHWLILVVPLYPLARFFIDDTYELPHFYVPWVLPFWCFYFLLTIIPVWSAAVRRLHTLPRKGWWLLIDLIPVVGWFIVLIWLLQKGNYEDFVRRLKQAGANNELFKKLGLALDNVNRPRNGGWFFVVFALLAAGGWFLNRHVKQSGVGEAVLAAFGEVNAGGLASLNLKPEADKSTVLVNQAGDAGPDLFSDGTVSAENIVLTPTLTIEADIHAEEMRPEPSVTLTIIPTFEPEEIIEAIETDVEEILQETKTPVEEVVQPVETEALRVTVVKMEAVPIEDVSDENESHELPIENLPLQAEPEPAAGQTDILSVSAETAVIAKKDGSLLLLTENDVLASVYAVTVGQFASCAADDACEMPEALDKLAYPGLEEKAAELPMVFVTCEQAAAYCEWAGMRLPTLDEWKTAASPADGFKISASTVNSVGTNRKKLLISMEQIALTIPVSSYRSRGSVYGMVQMLGNVWEWIASEDDLDVCNAAGGAWNSYPYAVSMDSLLETLPGYAADNIGFRCFADADMLNPDLFEISDEDPNALLNPGLRASDDAQMVAIPGSDFTMGAANGAVDEKPAHTVTLSDYWIDAYEVTNAQYALCVDDGACTVPHETKSFRRPSYFGNPEFDNFPVIFVDWSQAAAYCEWAGGRLPTEAEWEYAAKGPDGNAYPWGNKFDSKILNYSGNGDYDTLAVDANPEDVSPFGVYDMGGNVSEWVADRYQENWYTVTDQPVDPTGPEYGNYRVIRGSSAQGAENNARTADRFYAVYSSFAYDRGFRCVVKDGQ